MNEQKLTESKLIELAKECGYDAAVKMDVSALKFMPEVRAMCETGKCGKYGKNWTCPPACGSIEELEAKARRFENGILVQTIGTREDPFDYEGIENTQQKNKLNFKTLIKALQALGADFYAMGAGACTKCKNCAYPVKPCRHPDSAFPSMEACGLMVSQVCKDNGLPYYYGDDKISFTGCIFY